MYENVVAQILVSSGRKLYYHTWRQDRNLHSYEIDFLITNKTKIIPIEVKSSRIKPHHSLDIFIKKYSKSIDDKWILSQHDVYKFSDIKIWPIYCLPVLLEL